MDYGTGAIFGCPAMIKEIYFAKKYKLSITEVVSNNPNKTKNFNEISEAYVGDGTIINLTF